MNKLLSALALALFAGAATTIIAPIADAQAGTEKCRHNYNNVQYHLCGDKYQKKQTTTRARQKIDWDQGEGGGGRQ